MVNWVIDNDVVPYTAVRVMQYSKTRRIVSFVVSGPTTGTYAYGSVMGFVSPREAVILRSLRVEGSASTPDAALTADLGVVSPEAGDPCQSVMPFASNVDVVRSVDLNWWDCTPGLTSVRNEVCRSIDAPVPPGGSVFINISPFYSKKTWALVSVAFDLYPADGW